MKIHKHMIHKHKGTKQPTSVKRGKRATKKRQSTFQAILKRLKRYKAMLLWHIRRYAELLISIIASYLTIETMLLLHHFFSQATGWIA